MARVMIIDDSPTDTRLLEQMLNRHGYATVTAPNADEGIEIARTMHPDVILMDVVMPGLNGFQATRELVSDPVTAEIPVIIVTRKDQEADRQWGIRQGARHYLTKPISEDRLMMLIDDAIAV